MCDVCVNRCMCPKGGGGHTTMKWFVNKVECAKNGRRAIE